MLQFLGILEVLVLARYSVFIFLSSVLLFMLAEWKEVVLVVPWWLVVQAIEFCDSRTKS